MKELRIFLSSFLAFSYLILSIGIDLKAHYCHDEVASISVSFAESHCMCGDSATEMSCCSTEETLIQFDQLCLVQQKLSTEKNRIFVENEIILPTETEHREIGIFNDQFGLIRIEQRKFLLNSSLLYYG